METMVALTLFALCASAIGRLMTSQIRMASTNSLTSRAYALAEEELEAIRALDYTDITSASRSLDVGNVHFGVATVVQTNVPAVNLKTITVTVSWNEPTGSKNVALNTIYTAIKR
jgi:hypothetical protein